MANVPDDRAVSSLTKDVATAIETLKILTGVKASHLVGKSQRLPVEEITLAAGVAFLQTTKAGFIVSGVTGHGFLLKKVSSRVETTVRLLHCACLAQGDPDSSLPMKLKSLV